MRYLKLTTPNTQPDFGGFVTFAGERYYQICDVDDLPPFFISLAARGDHWLFISSSSGLTAGRSAPEYALFPYVPVDRIHESHQHTGSVTHIKVHSGGQTRFWSPFFHQKPWKGGCTRNLYKNTLGTKICFEEIHHEYQLTFRLTWSTSERFGFVASGEILNHGQNSVELSLLTGLQNILPANTPRAIQESSSNLVDAYKRSELDSETGLGLYTLYSAISDRAQANESLRANTAFCLGLDHAQTLISNDQLQQFLMNEGLNATSETKGVRGLHLTHARFILATNQNQSWDLVADTQNSQSQIVALKAYLQDPAALRRMIHQDVELGSRELARLVAGSDGLQASGEEAVTVHHYANVLFNIMRGGTFIDRGLITKTDFLKSVQTFNRALHGEAEKALQDRPAQFSHGALMDNIKDARSPQLHRLALEYLPISFGRRHGDPSRPWNHFEIKLKDNDGQRLLAYEGNWRDIFQNWEALSLSYPDFIPSMIAKFVNASTIDGYNPYRVSQDGIDWEVEDLEDPWSYIGYWGDHQIIYLLKFLELSEAFYPGLLTELMIQPLFSYANVPYRLKPFDEIVKDSKNTVLYDEALAEQIERRVSALGADGKLILTQDHEVYQVTLLEKLLVPMLSKLSNLVVGGGIWLNTQRPEWNDGNNALVGSGVSFVTLCYLQRYAQFLKTILASCPQQINLTQAVGDWLTRTNEVLTNILTQLQDKPLNPEQRFKSLKALGQAASAYRAEVYQAEVLEKGVFERSSIDALIDSALPIFERTIAENQRKDGLFQTYNLLKTENEQTTISHLHPMLEGQVAILSAKTLPPSEAVKVLDALFSSDIYRADQETFMLYPDRSLTDFLDKNRFSVASVQGNDLIQKMLAAEDQRLLIKDPNGDLRFHPDCTNIDALNERLNSVMKDYPLDQPQSARDAVHACFENVFNHHAFTGRSGGMFGFEGLGCIYWHMVAKLLLAVQETYFSAVDEGADTDLLSQLANHYYRIRAGFGFNKSPQDFGAFPTDPYSHTPKHAGAQQPGMTGQVKEEVLTRFGELGLRIKSGQVTFDPRLLTKTAFSEKATTFEFLDASDQWHTLPLSKNALGFTWCQVPIVYQLTNHDFSIDVMEADGGVITVPGQTLPRPISDRLISRSSAIVQLKVLIPQAALLS
ncbi:MAG: hypothetical protein P8N63_04650 [Pseudomonadales bacterium]|nr:hypothetical protein [Pseudomonadales bacterium]